MPIFFAIVVFIGFFGNLLVVLVVTFNKQMRNTTNLGRSRCQCRGSQDD